MDTPAFVPRSTRRKSRRSYQAPDCRVDNNRRRAVRQFRQESRERRHSQEGELRRLDYFGKAVQSVLLLLQSQSCSSTYYFPSF